MPAVFRQAIMESEAVSLELDLTRGQVTLTLARFALPLLGANLLQSLYNLADMAVVGRFLGSPGLAAVSSASTLCYILTSLCTGLATGGGVLAARCQGAGDRPGLRRVVGALCSLAAAAGILLAAGSLLLYGPVLRAMEVPPDAMPLALAYMGVICWGTPFVLGYNILCAVLRSLGDSRSPLGFVALAAAVNVGLDLLLVGPLDQGAFGAALATVAAQALSFLCALRSLLRRGFFRAFRSADFRPRLPSWGAILRMGLPTAAQMVVVNLSYLLVTGFFNGCGTGAAAAAGIGLKLNTFAAMPCWAVGQAVTTMAGQCVGAGNPCRAGRSALRGLALALASSGIVVAAVFWGAPTLVALFDPSPAVVAYGTEYLRRCCSLNFLAYAVMYVLDSFATGVGRPALAMGNALLHALVLRLGLSWLLGVQMAMGFSGLCWAEMLSPFPCALAGLLFLRLWLRRERPRDF